MAYQSNKFSPANLLLPTVLISVLGVYGYLAFRPALLTKRPATRAETGVAILDPITEVEARLWEDPFGPKYFEHYTNPPKLEDPPKPNDVKSSPEDEATTILNSLFRGLNLFESKRTTLSTEPESESEPESEPEVLILPVYVPSGQDPGLTDERMRARYAIISALTTGGYRAVLRNRIAYLQIDIPTQRSHGADTSGGTPSDETTQPLFVAMESFVPDVVDRFYDEDEFSRFKAVLLCWLDEDRIGSKPLYAARALFHKLKAEDHFTTPGPIKWKLRMIGPSNSDGLLTMAVDAKSMAKAQPKHFLVDTDWFARDYNESLLKGNEGEAGLPFLAELYSPRATLPTHRLKSKKEQLAEDYSVDAMLDQFVQSAQQRIQTKRITAPQINKAQANEPETDPANDPETDQNDFSEIGGNIGLRVYRTIGDDEQLVKALAKELTLRHCWPRNCNWPEEFDTHECVVLLTERDSLYGRMMPYLFSRELEQTWSFVATDVQPSSTAGNHRDFVIRDSNKLPDRDDIYVRITLERPKIIKGGQLIIGPQLDEDGDTSLERVRSVEASWNIDGYRIEDTAEGASDIAASPESTKETFTDKDFVGVWEIDVTGKNSSYDAKFEITSGTDTNGKQTLRGRWRLPAPLIVYRYLNRLDGWLASDNLKDPAQEGSDKKPSDLVSGYEPQGASQLDYIRRMENELAELHDWQVRHRGRGIISFGVVGSDVYDKMLLMRALVQRFPNALFFTTDLDANFSRPSEISHTRNLVVASHYGLKLHPSLQRGVPPFRHSYQTAMFFTALMAMDDPRAKNVLSDREPWYLWYPPPVKSGPQANVPQDGSPKFDGRKVELDPLIFEISSQGPYQITRTLPEGQSALLSSPVASVHPRRPDEPLGAVVNPPSPRDLQRWTFSQAMLATLIVASLVIILAFNLTAVGRAVIAVFVALGRILRWITTLGFSAVLYPLALVVAGTRRSGRDRPEQLMKKRFPYLKHATEFPTLHETAIVVALLLPCLVLGLIARDHRSPDGEPFEMFLGISVWPSTLIQMIAAIASIAFIWRGLKQLNDVDRNISKNLLHFHDQDEANPANWRFQEFIKWGFIASPKSGWSLSRSARLCRLLTSSLWKRIYLFDWKVPDDRIESVLRHFIRKGRPWARLLRVFVMSLMFAVLAWSLFAFTHERLTSPHRGNLAHRLGDVVWLSAVTGLIVLVFFVVDATLLCQRFVKVFQQRRVRWPKQMLDSASASHKLVDDDDLCDFMAIEIIATRSNEVGKLLYYPCSVLLLMVFARLQTFDRWSMPLPMIIVFALLLLALILHSLVLRREAADTKAAVLSRLLASRSRLATHTPPEDRDVRETQLSVITQKVEREKRGAFRPLSEDDLVKAFTIPFGGAGGLLLLEQILN